MAKTLTPEKIISSLPSLSEDDLMSVAKELAKEGERRTNELNQQIKEAETKREILLNGGGGK